MENQRIVITGGGSGLGRALALEYARFGWRVALLDRDAVSAEVVAAEVAQAGGMAMALACDVADTSATGQVAGEVLQAWGAPDVLINNAGIAGSGTVVDTPDEDWHSIMDINLFGVVNVCRAFIPAMMAARTGHVVNIASAAGFASPPGVAAYNVSKAAVIALSETLRGETAPHGIGVSVACPSFFRTNLLDQFRGSEESRALAGRLMDKSPLDAADVARLIRRGVDRRQFMIVPHSDARRLLWLKRMAPELFHAAVCKRATGFIRGKAASGRSA